MEADKKTVYECPNCGTKHTTKFTDRILEVPNGIYKICTACRVKIGLSFYNGNLRVWLKKYENRA